MKKDGDYLRDNSRKIVVSKGDYIEGDQINLQLISSSEKQPPKMPSIPTVSHIMIGRDEIKDSIQQDIDKGQPISLCGMAGIGKTCLAAKIAYERELGGSKVLWLTVGQQDWDVVYNHIGHIFDDKRILRLSGSDKRFRARELLHEYGVKLVFLDDVWNGTEARRFVRDALPAGCGLLLTSRERVGMGKVYDVTPLDKQASANLFLYNAAIQNDTRVDELCSYLAGHPLALEIAGKMFAMSGMSLKELQQRLRKAETRIQELALSDDISENVWSSLSLSYDILEADERKVFRSFGVIWNKFATVELLSSVTEIEIDALKKNLATLFSRSLIIPEDTLDDVRRYRMHDLIHDFTYALLTKEQEADQLRERILVAYRNYVKLYGSENNDDHNHLNAEWENLRSAVKWAAERREWGVVNDLTLGMWSHSYFMHRRGYSREAVNLLQLGVRAANALGNSADEAEQLGSLADAYKDIGKMREALDHYQEAIKISHTTGNLKGEARYLHDMGLTYAVLGLTDKAIRYYKQSLQIATDTHDKQREATVLGNMGWAYMNDGLTENAISCINQAVTIEKKIKDQHGEEIDIGSLGDIYLQLGQAEEALVFSRKALKIARKIRSRRGEGRHLSKIGYAHLILGEISKAIGYFQKALKIAREIDARRAEGIDLGYLGVAYHQIGHTKTAIQYFQAALNINEEVENRIEEGKILNCLGEAYLELGQLDDAMKIFNEALDLNRNIKHQRGEAISLSNIGYVHLKLGHADKAIDSCEQAKRIIVKIGDQLHEGIIKGYIGEALLNQGHVQLSEPILLEALDIHRRIKYRRGIATHLHNIGRLNTEKTLAKLNKKSLEHLQNAVQGFEESLAIRSEIGDPHGESETLPALEEARLRLNRILRRKK
ncbi:MAG: tetratricopeptide repeat protein [Chloroflexi bacterium]|nr:tetratricopeptide repeat protein [Chloroflexota bacterium]